VSTSDSKNINKEDKSYQMQINMYNAFNNNDLEIYKTLFFEYIARNVSFIMKFYKFIFSGSSLKTTYLF
jgi:hypothetical protein